MPLRHVLRQRVFQGIKAAIEVECSAHPAFDQCPEIRIGMTDLFALIFPCRHDYHRDSGLEPSQSNAAGFPRLVANADLAREALLHNSVYWRDEAVIEFSVTRLAS